MVNNLILFRKLEDSVNKAPPQIRELTLGEVKEIPPQILLGFYTQYIDRCKEGFYERGPVEFILMYMRRLFFYLFYHILHPNDFVEFMEDLVFLVILSYHLA